MATSNLKVPQSSANFSKQSISDIMNAYNSQSKIQLYDDSTSSTENGLDGVKGKDIPLSALRPNQHQIYDAQGNNVYTVPKTRRMEDAIARADIVKAYNKMRGIAENGDNDNIDMAIDNFHRDGKDLSGVIRKEAEYIEEIPDTDEGLLEVLALAIKNAQANLEMLMSLYTALSGEDIRTGTTTIDNEDDIDLVDLGEEDK